jgi:UDP-N-acetylglucosamine 2-epimerase
VTPGREAVVVAIVVGARPEFVQSATLSRAIVNRRSRGDAPAVAEVLIHTGQHYDAAMSDVFFRDLGLTPPTHHLGVGSALHGAQTGEMMKRLEPALVDLRPDVVVVFGDTNSTLAAALVAAKLHLPVAHVEAGLRSFNRQMPEEINRCVTDHISDLLLCPSAQAAGNLEREGITDGVHITGDVMLDALEWVMPDSAQVSAVLDRYGLVAGGYAVATVHRAENTDDAGRLGGLLTALGDVAADGLPVILPLHPRTAGSLDGLRVPAGVRPVEPVGHAEMVALASGARIGLTDSGGLQKELYWLGVPCVTMRAETEWVETVAAGWNVVAGVDPTTVVAAARRMVSIDPGDRPPIYGSGGAAHRILDLLVEHFAPAPEPIP